MGGLWHYFNFDSCLRLPDRRWRPVLSINGATNRARIVLHLLHVLRENKAKRGIATICIGGGLGGAMLVEAGA